MGSGCSKPPGERESNQDAPAVAGVQQEDGQAPQAALESKTLPQPIETETVPSVLQVVSVKYSWDSYCNVYQLEPGFVDCTTEVQKLVKEQHETICRTGRLIIQDMASVSLASGHQRDPAPGNAKELTILLSDGSKCCFKESNIAVVLCPEVASNYDADAEKYRTHADVKSAFYCGLDVTIQVQKLFDLSGAAKAGEFCLKDFNSCFGNPKPEGPRVFTIMLQDGRETSFNDDEVCKFKVRADPSSSNFSYLNITQPTNAMTKAEVEQVLRDAGITYAVKYRSYDKCPVDAINKYCEEHGKVFVDPWYYFVDYDLEGENHVRIDWHRPLEIKPDCFMFHPDGLGCKVEDTCQGGIGNCGVTSMAGQLQSLLSQPLVKAIYPKKINPYGVYSVKTFSEGSFDRWVVFDDLFACKDGRLWSWHSPDGTIMWPAFAEKIMSTRTHDYNCWPKSRFDEKNFWCTRYFDCYCPGGHTFPIVEPIKIANDATWPLLEQHAGKDAACCTGFGGHTLEAVHECERMGLIMAHGYALIKAATVQPGSRRFLKFRNPWGCGVFRGDWSPDSEKWREEPDVAAVLRPDGLKEDSGEFWMLREDWYKYSYTGADVQVELLMVASPSEGFKLDCAVGVLPNDMDFNTREGCLAIPIRMPLASDKDCSMFLYHAECVDTRMHREGLRLYIEIYELDENMRRKTSAPLYSTMQWQSKWPEPPSHYLAVDARTKTVEPNTTMVPASANLLFVLRPLPADPGKPNLPFAGQKCYLRFSSRPGHPDRSQGFSLFSDFPAVEKVHWAIKSASYHLLDVTEAVQKMADDRAKEGEWTIDFDGQYHHIFGDPAPGVSKKFHVKLTDGTEYIRGDFEAGILELPRDRIHQH